MKKLENKDYTVVNIGNMNDIKYQSLIHPKSGEKINGKVFLKEITKSTGTEISFNYLPPKTELGYFHIHKKNEETYIIIKGAGYFQVNDDCFPINEGSVIRVAPNGIRSLCNTSDKDMVYICIQSRINSLEEYSAGDSTRIVHDSKLKELL